MSSAFDIPGGGAAPVIDTSTLATKTQLASAVAAIIAAIPPAAAGGGAVVGEVKTIALNAAGQVPDGYALVNSIPAMPLGGLDFTFLASTGVANFGIDNGGSSMAQDTAGKVHWINGGTGAHMEYNLATGVVAAGAALPSSYAVDGALARLASGRIMFTGGIYFTGYNYYMGTGAAFVFNGIAWSAIASLPVDRFRLALALLGNGKMLAVGGNTDSNYWGGMSNRCDVYDESTNTWTQVASAPVRGIGPAVSLPDGCVLWMPFSTYDGATAVSATNRAFVFDGTTNSWSETDALPETGAVDCKMGLAADESGALLTNAALGASVRRYTAGNALGTRWTNLRFVGPVFNNSNGRGASVLKLIDGRVLTPTNSVGGATGAINVRYNAGNTVVQARKT